MVMQKSSKKPAVKKPAPKAKAAPAKKPAAKPAQAKKPVAKAAPAKKPVAKGEPAKRGSREWVEQQLALVQQNNEAIAEQTAKVYEEIDSAYDRVGEIEKMQKVNTKTITAIQQTLQKRSKKG